MAGNLKLATEKISDDPFRLLVQSIIDYAIYMLDPNGYVTSWNAGAARIKGFQTEEIVGKWLEKKRDQFVLATDGLTRLVPDEEIAAELGRGSPADAADRLIDTVLARGAPDNVTLIIASVL